MKKLLFLLVSTILLTGCTAQNGVVNSKDLEDIKYENIKPLLERQKNIAIIPEDVRGFLNKLDQVKKENLDQEDTMGYLSIGIERFAEDQPLFMYETALNDYANENEKTQFYKLIDVLDQTIAEGILEFLRENEPKDLTEENISEKIGRVWVQISKPVHDDNYLNSEGINVKDLKNDIIIWIKVRDIKDEKYKKLVSILTEEDLILNDIKIGEHRDSITLENIEFKNRYGTRKAIAISYNLFIKDGTIEKVRTSIVSPKDSKIMDSDLDSLKKIASVLEFETSDIKSLEKIETMIKENKQKSGNTQSDKFSFNYKALKSNNYRDNMESTKIIELIIEKRK